VEGTVTDTDGKPVPGARLEVWESDETGQYDVQYDVEHERHPGGDSHLEPDRRGRAVGGGRQRVRLSSYRCRS